VGHGGEGKGGGEETRREGGAARVIDARLRMCKVVIILLIWAVKSVEYVLWVIDLAGGICLEKISIIVEITREQRSEL